MAGVRLNQTCQRGNVPAAGVNGSLEVTLIGSLELTPVGC